MRGKRRRIWEGVKTLLIVLLSISAVYLAGRTLFPRQTGWFFSRLSQNPSGSPSAQTVLSDQTLRPAAFAVTWEGGRYGVLYHQDDQETYTLASALLAEALNDASAPDTVTRRAWEEALASPGLFCEYLGPMPLDALSRWLSGQESAQLSGAWAKMLCVTARSLCYQTADGGYYACPLTTDLTSALAGLAGGCSANGAHFAWESGSYATLRRDSLILPGAPSLPRLYAEDPIPLSDLSSPPESLSTLLQSLSFHPQTNSLYATTGGWVINDGGETLRLDAAGHLTYRRTSTDSARYPVGPSALDATRALAESTVGALCGNGRLYLRHVRQEGASTVITYGCAYRGTAIQRESEGWCAQFTVTGGAVESFTLKLRRYTAQADNPVLLLPQEQAAAALTGPGNRTLELIYEDDGQRPDLIPFWAVRSEGR